MSADRSCPHCGSPQPARTRPGNRAVDHQADPAGADEAGGASMALLGPGSHDDDFVAARHGPKVAMAEPDPILGDSAAPPRPEPVAYFPKLDVSGPRPTRSRPPEEDEDDLGPPEREAPWSRILLASYASAVTLALGWTLWQRPRAAREPVAAVAPKAEARPASGRQAGLSRTVAPPEPIVAEHLADPKAPLVVGSLEVTPLDVRRENIRLQRTSLSGRSEQKDGGRNALVLRLRLRNTSRDAVFAPLDQAYLREREKEVVDTFLESASGDRVYPYPLAVESEWSIAGQDFGELRPGETRVVPIASVPDAPAELPGPLTWRVRLRTGINRTDAVGVRLAERLPGLLQPPKR